jgi:hypothetical protein
MTVASVMGRHLIILVACPRRVSALAPPRSGAGLRAL